MAKFFLYILWMLLTIIVCLWYFTCTKHKKVPLILVLLFFTVGFIPIINVFSTLFGFWALLHLVDEKIVELKDNWFNRTFLAYNAK